MPDHTFSRRGFVVAGSLLTMAWTTSGRADAPDASEETIEGNVVYRERMMLPKGARVEVELADVSRADAPSVTIARAEIDDAAASPIPYRLTYDPKLIDPRGRFALQARILDGERLMFVNMTHHAAFGDERETTDILVQRVAAAPVPALSLYGAWLAEDIGGGGVIDRAQTTLEIAPDGAVTGSGGCNRYSGPATIDGEKLSFGMMVMTNKGCVEALMNQEMKFHETLLKVASYSIDPLRKKLSLLDGQGVIVMVLAAHEG